MEESLVGPNQINIDPRHEKFLAQRNLDSFTGYLVALQNLFNSAANRVNLAGSDITFDACAENPQYLWFRLQTVFAAFREATAAAQAIENMSRDVVEFTQHIERMKFSEQQG